LASVFDVAAYILNKQGPMTAMKLQKLVYYSQAWSLVWDEERLFGHRVEAWAMGPVVPTLYQAHRGKFRIARRDLHGRPSKLTVEQRRTIDGVLDYYGGRSSQWLSDLTHAEEPWRQARKGLEPGERGHNEMPPASMAEYYGSL